MTRSTAPTPSRRTPATSAGQRYNPVRGSDVIAWARTFLNDAVPLRGTGWAAARGFSVRGGALAVTLGRGTTTLTRPEQFVGYRGDAAAPEEILLRNNGLGIRIVIDAGQHDRAR